MKPLLVTGSSGHLGEAILRLCAERNRPALGLDRVSGPFTTHLADLRRPDDLVVLTAQPDAVIEIGTALVDQLAAAQQPCFTRPGALRGRG